MIVLATMALAQPRTKGAAKSARTAPAPAKIDAQASPPADATEASDDVLDAGVAGDELPPAHSEASDGGRWSPLNPSPEELPSAAVDAGVPVDYDRLLADIAALRARVAAVSDTLYRSRVSVALQIDGDHSRIHRLAVSLDDGVVFTAPSTFSASDSTVVYDHAVAPGRHAVTVEVDRADARNETFRTSQRSRFMIEVPREHRVDLRVKLIDDSNMADYPSDRSGNYDLRFRVKAIAKPVGK